MGKYNEICRLKEMLEKANIPHEFVEHLGGYALIYPNDMDRVCSAVEHDYSYGRDEDKLEIMGLLTEEESRYDSVAGFLTANDVFERIQQHYERRELMKNLYK